MVRLKTCKERASIWSSAQNPLLFGVESDLHWPWISGPTPEELEEMRRQEEEARQKKEAEEKAERERREAEEATERKRRQEEWVCVCSYMLRKNTAWT